MVFTFAENEITVTNLTTGRVGKKWLKNIARNVLKGEGRGDSELSIVLVGQKRMRELNRRYRKKNKSTDVLSFPESRLSPFSVSSKNGVYLGEIVISLWDVKKNAKRFGIPWREELARDLIHGILHLVGYNHEKSDSEAKKMFQLQEHYLKLSH